MYFTWFANLDVTLAKKAGAALLYSMTVCWLGSK
jgi:hypothetical protein